MGAIYLQGWDDTNGKWVRCAVTSDGKLIINPTAIIDQTPTSGDTDKAISSDWAYDHSNDASAHHIKYTDSDARSSINDIFDSNGKPTNNIDVYYQQLINVQRINFKYSISTTKYVVLLARDNLTNIDLIGYITAGGYSAVKIRTHNGTSYRELTDQDHDHTGGNGAQIDHTTLSNIGTNTHAQIDSYISDGSARIKVTLPGGQSIPSLSFTKVQFNNETYDIYSEYDNTTNYRFVAASDGYYDVNYSLQFASTAWAIGNYIICQVWVNGVAQVRSFYEYIQTTNTVGYFMQGHDTVYLTAGQRIELYIIHSNSSSVSLDNSGNYNQMTINKLK